MSGASQDPIAIVGIGTLVPGAGCADDFWAALVAGDDLRTRGGPELFGTGPDVPGGWGDPAHHITSVRGGFATEPEIDLTGLGLSPERIDGAGALGRWTVHVVRQAIESLRPEPGRTGIILGNYSFPTPESVALCVPAARGAVARGLQAAGLSVGAAPVAVDTPIETMWPSGLPVEIAAEAFGFAGPRLALDAACSSTLYAMRLACDYLSTGAADLMLAGAICAPDPLLIHLSFSDLHAYPDNGISSPFDRESTGIVTGQGAGVFALERLSDAMRNGHRVHAVIDAIALSNDGAGAHPLVPNIRGQLDTYRSVYRPGEASVDYIECHATGTPRGDSIELRGIESFFGADIPLLGSVKGNVGHLLTVAGFTSALKTILAMQHGEIPATRTGGALVSPRGGERASTRIVTQTREWPRGGESRRAGVSAFGFGGTNAHLILREPPRSLAGSARISANGHRVDPPGAVIVGVGVRVGPVAGARALHAALRSGKRSVVDLPDQRWFGLEDPQSPAPAAGYAETIDVPVGTYRLPPNELARANPQHLLLFEAVEEALNDAAGRFGTVGSGTEAPRRRIAVVIAMDMEPRAHAHRARFDIGRYLREECARAGVSLSADRMDAVEAAVRDGVHEPIGANEVISYIGNVMASRICAAHNFDGPSFAMSTDGAGGIRAFEVARLLLSDPTIEAVVVGGVELAAGYENTRARATIESDTGPVVLGDGAAAALVLRQDDPRGVGCPSIESIVIRDDGNPTESLHTALAGAGRSGAEIDHLVFAGAADSATLAEVAGAVAADCVIGAPALIVGDSRHASAVIAVVAAVTAMRLNDMPPPPTELRPVISEGGGPVATEPTPWLSRAGGRRVALVRAVGNSSRADLVLSAPPIPHQPSAMDVLGVVLLPLAGANSKDVVDRARQYLERLDEGGSSEDLMRAAITDWRSGTADNDAGITAVIVAGDRDGLRTELRAAVRLLVDALEADGRWATPAGSYCTARPLGGGKVAFVYPGAFTAYPGAGRDLFLLFPDSAVETEAGGGDPRAGFRIDRLYPAISDRSALMAHESAMVDSIPTMLAIGTGLAVLATRILHDELGIRRDGALGYSLGESSMLFATGVWDGLAAADRAISDSPLFVDGLTGPKTVVRDHFGIDDDVPDAQVWTTRVLLAPEHAVRDALVGNDRVFLTHINTPNEVVVAGDPERVRAIIEQLGCKSAKAPANHVMHCSAVDSVEKQLAGLNDHPVRGEPAAELLSAYDYAPIPSCDRTALADRIARTLCTTVDFPRLVNLAYDRGYRIFVEVGPAATCSRWIDESLADREHLAISIDRRGAPASLSLARAVAQLVAHGVPVALERLLPPQPAPGFRVPVICGGESIADRVRDRVAPLVSGRPAHRSAAPSSPIDRITVEGEPFVDPYLIALATAVPDLAAPITADPAAPVAAESAAPATAERLASVAVEPTVRVATEPAAVATVAPQPVATVAPQPVATVAQQPVAMAAPQPVAGGAGRLRQWSGAGARAAVLAPLRNTVIDTHLSVLRVHQAWTTEILDAAVGPDGGSGRGRPPAAPDRPAPDSPVIWDEADLLEFASGRVATVFGADYAQIDTYPVRVRLPEPPYHFVTRVTELDAIPGRFERCSITTEYDVPVDAWYAVDGLVPCAVTIEAGQCDLLLVAYLGIDFDNRGERVYRLLDSDLVFHGGLPRVGQTLRYEITIDRFVRSGDTTLFFFAYKCYADGVLILELLRACAGFFSARELDDSLGVVTSAADRARRAAMTPTWFKPLARTERTSLGPDDLDRLTAGAPGEVFGPAWEQRSDGSNPSLRLPDPMLRMIDEITSIDRLGGPVGLGEITAVKYLDPDGWYFRCHFPGDPVLAGSLVAEGGVQLLQIYALYLGVHLVFPDAEFQSVPGLKTSVKVRGQISPTTTSIRYHVEITGITMLPRPTITADIVVYDGDKPMVGMNDFGVRVQEKPTTAFRPLAGGIPPFLGRRTSAGEPVFINELHLAHAAKGDLAVAMGDEFEIYRNRRAPYIPNGDFRFVDRIVAFGGRRGELVRGATMETEYDAPPEAWYFHENAWPGIPNCVLMESSLQSAILLGYYLGATLETPDDERSIRNLDGRATVVKHIDLRGKTIRQHTTMLSSRIMPGTSLQNFRYELSADGDVFYVGESLFGYHTVDALASQAGLDNSTYVAPWLELSADHSNGSAPRVRSLSVGSEDHWYAPDAGLHLPNGHLRLIDSVEIVTGGGKFGLGYLRGTRKIDPTDWYFDCHFHRDPVMPGSLGVEAIIAGLQVWAIDAGLGRRYRRPTFALPLDVEMRWRYRGQILRGDDRMVFDLHISDLRVESDRTLLIATANLWKPELRIYELTDIAVEIRESPGRAGTATTTGRTTTGRTSP